MTKSELVERLLIKFQYLTRKDAQLAVDVFFKEIRENLLNDREITIRGFGTFFNKKRNKAIARNPRTGEKLTIEARKLPAFKAGKKIISRMND